MDIGVRPRWRDLRGDRAQQQVGVSARQPRVERQLHEQVGAMRDAMAPALSRDETAIVAHPAQIGRAGVSQIMQFGVGQKGLDAVGARDLGQRQRREGAVKTRLVIGRSKNCGQPLVGMAENVRLQMLAAQSLRP